MRVVTPRSLPADLPKSAIPGIMKPTMIRGIVKPKKLPKIELNVAKILTILGKLRFPITIPKIMVLCQMLGCPTTKSPFRNSARHLPSSFFANSHRESGS